MVKFVCTNCSAEFALKRDHGKHRKICLMEVETFIFKPSNEKITVKKNDQGSFDCYCSDAGCPSENRVYKSIENLKKHMKKVKSHWVGLSKVGSAYTYTDSR